MARMAEGSFSNAPEFYAVERWVLCCVQLGFVRDGLNTLELARVLKGQDHTGADRKHVELDCFNLP